MKKSMLSTALFIFAGAAICISQPSPLTSDEPNPGKMPMMTPFGGPPGMHSSIENPPPMMMNPAELQKLMAEISIDKSISTKIMAISRTFVNFLNEHIIKVQREELNIKEELLKEKPDMQAIQSVINKKSQIFGEIEYAQIKRDLDIKSLLTQDEYDRWKSAMMQKMRQMMPEVMGKFPPNQFDKKAPSQK